MLDGFDRRTKLYLFGFLGGGSGYGRLYFDCVKNTVRYPVGDYPEIQKRFIDLYGIKPVNLNIR